MREPLEVETVSTDKTERAAFDAYPPLPQDRLFNTMNNVTFYSEDQMRAYVDADRKARQLAACNFCLAQSADLIDAARRLERRGFFAPSACADAETAADMTLMRKALASREEAPAASAESEDMDESGNPEESETLEDRLRMAFTHLGAIRRRYGEPGSRDFDVAASNRAISLARKAIYDVLATPSTPEADDTPLETGEGDAR